MTFPLNLDRVSNFYTKYLSKTLAVSFLLGRT